MKNNNRTGSHIHFNHPRDVDTINNMVELFNCFNCRSERHSIFSIGFLSNKWLIAAVLSSFIITLALIYVPFFQDPFHTYNMSLWDWGIVILAGSTVLWVVEIAKIFIRKHS